MSPGTPFSSCSPFFVAQRRNATRVSSSVFPNASCGLARKSHISAPSRTLAFLLFASLSRVRATSSFSVASAAVRSPPATTASPFLSDPSTFPPYVAMVSFIMFVPSECAFMAESIPLTLVGSPSAAMVAVVAVDAASASVAAVVLAMSASSGVFVMF